MKKNLIIGIICYVITGVLTILFLATSVSVKLIMPELEKVIVLCVASIFTYFGGRFLTKYHNSKKYMKISIWVMFILYLLLLINFIVLGNNFGRNFDIDTKLLMLNELCYKISKDDSAYYKDNRVWEIFFDIYYTYAKMNSVLSSHKSNQYEKNQVKIINEINQKLLKFRNKKNLLFIYPIPQIDFLFTLYVKGLNKNKYYDFSNSYMSIFIKVLSLLKKDTNFTNDLYFAYCLFDGTYNLIKVDINGYISEAFIPVNKQKDFLCPLNIGIRDTKGFHTFRVERYSNTNHLTTKCSYINDSVETIYFNDKIKDNSSL